MQNETKYIQQDTIDLRELFAVLKRRRKMIWGVTALLTILAIIYAFFITKPLYEVRAMIEIGKIDSKPIDNINNILQKISYEYHINGRGGKIGLPRVKAISSAKKSDSILSVTIHGNTNEEATIYIQKVIKKIESQYKEKTNAYINGQKKLIEIVNHDIIDTKSDLKNLQTEIDKYSSKIVSLKSEDAALAGIFALQIGQKQTYLNDLKIYITEQKNKKQDLELSLTPVKMKPTQIVGNIETNQKPIKPNKKLIVIVAFITGLMLSVFLAFFLEFIKGLRKPEIEKDN